MRSLVGFVPFFSCAALIAGSAAQAETLVFKGICNASAAVALDENRIIVGDDEQPWLSVYSVKGGESLDTVDLTRPGGMAEGDKKKKKKRKKSEPEADIEGATVFNDRIVWISSNGRNKDGEVKAGRFQLFASHRLDADRQNWEPGFSSSFHGLPAAIAGTRDEGYEPLRQSIGDLKQKNKDLAPKEHGFNVEGLSVSRDGKDLLVGLRNPQPGGEAALFSIENADDLLDGRTTEAVLGPVVTLALGGRGIRDIAWSPARHAYLIAAGQVDDEDDGPGFALFTWDGVGSPKELQSLRSVLKSNGHFHPEAVVPLLERSEGKLVPSKSFLVISDDGKRPLAGDTACEDAEQDQWSFRAVVVTGD